MITKIIFVIALISCSRGLDSTTNSMEYIGGAQDHTAQKYEALINQNSSNQNPNLKVALANYPAQSSSKKYLTIRVTGAANVARYAFKIGKSTYMNCADHSGYQTAASLSAPIVLQMDRYDEGPVTLCVIGGSRDLKWLPYNMANQVIWENRAPSANAPVAQPNPVQDPPALEDDPDSDPDSDSDSDSDSSCSDTQVDRYSCQQQKSWGKCDASWMISGNHCQKTCGRCE